MAETKALTFNQTLTGLVAKTNNEVERLSQKGELSLPGNYSAGNALKQFQLMIQDNDDIKSCTSASIAKCMLDMVIMGLNPSKKQCYCIKYGNKAQLMPSYLGNAAMAKRIDPTIENITARTIHTGEEFEFEDDLVTGYSHVTKHTRTLNSMAVNDPEKDIVGAYSTITYNDGKQPVSLIMPFSEIKKRWAKSQTHPIDASGKVKVNSTHFQFPDKMCERTVINAICVPIIAKSDDDNLFGSTVQSVTVEAAKAEADAEAYENMCAGDMIDIEGEFEEVPDIAEKMEAEQQIFVDNPVDV